MTIIGSVIDLNAVVICFNNFSVWQSLFISCDICLSKVLLLAIFLGEGSVSKRDEIRNLYIPLSLLLCHGRDIGA